MEKITQNFNREEFTCNCGCGFMDINHFLVNRLQVIRDIINLPMMITSGCRCENWNKTVGGKPHSLHLMGLAADWWVEDYSMKHVALMLHEWSGGFHFYEEENFIHCDLGIKRRWQ